MITPKLLADLRYHHRMVTHCVYSGDVQEGLIMDSKKYVSVGRQMMMKKKKASRMVAAN